MMVGPLVNPPASAMVDPPKIGIGSLLAVGGYEVVEVEALFCFDFSMKLPRCCCFGYEKETEGEGKWMALFMV